MIKNSEDYVSEFANNVWNNIRWELYFHFIVWPLVFGDWKVLQKAAPGRRVQIDTINALMLHLHILSNVSSDWLLHKHYMQSVRINIYSD